MNDDLLRESLGDLAETVHNVDLYDRALSRSRRIGRDRAMAGVATALAVLGLAGAGLWALPQLQRPDNPPAMTSSPALPSSRIAPSSSPGSHPTTNAAGPHFLTPQSRSLSDLPGRVFYRQPESGTVIRLAGNGARTVLNTPNQDVAVSPDGNRFAYVTSDGQLFVTGRSTPLLSGYSDERQQPAWSPDGTELLVATARPALLTVSSGTLKSLPNGLGGDDFRYSGDGRKLVYGTPSCRLMIASAGGSSGTTVPVLGDPDSGRNPSGTAACHPASVDRTGRRAAVTLQSVNGGSSAGDAATAIADTSTGELIPPPVRGDVQALAFNREGNLLIRTSEQQTMTLSVLSPSGRLLVQAREPAALESMTLIAYTG